MAGDHYCGKCHTWMYPLYGAGPSGGRVIYWMCDCPTGLAVFDTGTGEMPGWRPLRKPKIEEK